MGGVRGFEERIFFLEQYAKRINITNHHTKLELDNSKQDPIVKVGHRHRHKHTRHPPVKDTKQRFFGPTDLCSKRALSILRIRG